MGMPISVEIVDNNASSADIASVYNYFLYINDTFSTYKQNSEITRINKGLHSIDKYSKDVKTVLQLCEQTKRETLGYFNIKHNGLLDPSGLVKGWAIQKAALLLRKKGLKNFYIDAGGDIAVFGKNKKGSDWVVGIRNPFNRFENVKTLSLSDKGIATSGTAIRGQHVYNPHHPEIPITDVVSMTIIGPNIYEADRFATAAFVMGRKGIEFIETLVGFEGYMIDNEKQATYTSGFEKYVV